MRGRLLADTFGSPDRCCDRENRPPTCATQAHEVILSALRTLQGLHDRGFVLLNRPIADDDFVQLDATHECFFKPRAVRDVLWQARTSQLAVLFDAKGDDIYQWDTSCEASEASSLTEEGIVALQRADTDRLRLYFGLTLPAATADAALLRALGKKWAGQIERLWLTLREQARERYRAASSSRLAPSTAAAFLRATRFSTRRKLGAQGKGIGDSEYAGLAARAALSGNQRYASA